MFLYVCFFGKDMRKDTFYIIYKKEFMKCINNN